MAHYSAELEHKRLSIPLDRVDADGTFSGYASLFGKVDLGKDQVQAGAFRQALLKRPAADIRMLFQHDPAEPIGTWIEVCEDHKGLFVRGRIVQESRKAKEVLALMRGGAVDGLSIGFRTKRSRTDRKTGIRTILEADLWEISVVTFPMLPQARVTQIKAASGKTAARRLPSIRQFERWLTQDAGLTRSEARTIIGKGFAALASRRDAAGTSTANFADRIRSAAQTLKANRT